DPQGLHAGRRAAGLFPACLPGLRSRRGAMPASRLRRRHLAPGAVRPVHLLLSRLPGAAGPASMKRHGAVKAGAIDSAKGERMSFETIITETRGRVGLI